MLNPEIKRLRDENNAQKTEIAYLKAKIAYLYAEMIEIAKGTVPVDCNPKNI